MVEYFSPFHSYYGLSVWFPDVIKHLQSEKYASEVHRFYGKKYIDTKFNFTLENQIHIDGEFTNDRSRKKLSYPVLVKKILLI